MSETEQIIKRVAYWVESAVIGLNLCPFAEPIFNHRGINYVVSESGNIDALMFELYQEIDRLQENPGLETTLLTIPFQLLKFEDFNESLDFVDALLEAYAWIGKFQIAGFHPHYRFEGTQYNDRENWSNRSPYPIYHILREHSIASAIANHPAPDRIPANNIHTLNSLDQISFEQIFFADCCDKP